MSFGARLRQERERRQISIASIAETTKILGALLEGLENDDVSRWPTGFYRRAFIRAYAVAIGLDPDPVVKEFMARFPDPDETPAAAPAAVTPAPVARPAEKAAAPTTAAPANGGEEAAVVRGVRQRLFAAGLDLFVLSVLGVVVFALLGVFWAPFAVITAAYYSLSILVLGNTPGVCLFADRPRSAPTGLRLVRSK